MRPCSHCGGRLCWEDGHLEAVPGRFRASLALRRHLRTPYRRREFFGGSTPVREFSIPKSKPEVIYKLSENIYEFIGNYLLIALLCVVCVLCASLARPRAICGSSQGFAPVGQRLTPSSVPPRQLQETSGAAGDLHRLQGLGLAPKTPAGAPLPAPERSCACFVTSACWGLTLRFFCARSSRLLGGNRWAGPRDSRAGSGAG